MPTIVWTIDRNTRFTSVIGAGIEALGGQPGVINVPVHEALGHTDAHVPVVAAHERALGGSRASYSAAWNGRSYDCTVEPLTVRGRIAGSIGVAVDVTERDRARTAAARAIDEAVDCLVRAIESRDPSLAAHGQRMSTYCATIVQALGADCEWRQAISIAARLHDIGKIGIPDELLLKPGPLTHSERTVLERHCRTGYEILVGAESEILQLAAVIALTHHEWFDGSGYPQHLAGDAIPLEGRIAAIADSFDALTSTRSYRPALPCDEALGVMIHERGTHFDPALFDLFVETAATTAARRSGVNAPREEPVPQVRR